MFHVPVVWMVKFVLVVANSGTDSAFLQPVISVQNCLRGSGRAVLGSIRSGASNGKSTDGLGAMVKSWGH